MGENEKNPQPEKSGAQVSAEISDLVVAAILAKIPAPYSNDAVAYGLWLALVRLGGEYIAKHYEPRSFSKQATISS